MEKEKIKGFFVEILPAGIVFIALGSFLVYGYLQFTALTQKVDSLSAKLASTTALLLRNADSFSQNITDLRAQDAGLSSTLSSAQQNIDAVKTQVGGVEQTVGTISGTVGDLQKLSKTDPELLKKYSKVYFMNENYIPRYLFDIPNDYLYSVRETKQFSLGAWPFVKDLIDTAKREGVTLYIKSAYRSFGVQQTLKSSYTVIYGAGTANSFSADQGYSEHQLGTTVDFITTGLGGKIDGFDKTESYQWLVDNAHRFGFVLSYPKNNNYYVYEPWHWRFVGIKLATYLHDNNLNFYDLDQRAIDEYLLNIFDL